MNYDFIYTKEKKETFIIFIILTLLIVVAGIGGYIFYINSKSEIYPKLKNLEDYAFTEFKHIESNTKVTLKIAKSNEALAAGLMFVEDLEENEGMIFVFPEEAQRVFWMKNTKISLDIIYLDSEFRVISFYQSTKPDQIEQVYPSNSPSQYVIELEAGWALKNKLKLGDTFVLID